ncbi:MAG: NAD(P)-dependent alcohol dehydrogenase [Blastocatellia bacterium]|nr:NAD(P)-dependent alcohol dehydrogenase [Blastocatellia bacterium]
MKLFEILNNEGIENLQLVEKEIPQPGSGQVLVKVHATSLNYRDLVIVEGVNGKLKQPMVPLSDGAGEVVAVGPHVTLFKVGDRVAGTFFQKWVSGEINAEAMKSAMGGAINGMLAEYVVLGETGVVKIPDHLSYEEAATLPCAAVTVWNALVSRGKLTSGETLLIQGTGGVSVFAAQFAQRMGARVIATSSSDEKLEKLKEFGVTEGVNYRTTPDWEKAVLSYTGGKGVDHVIEVGGAGTFGKSLKAVRFGGHISLIGVLTGFSAEINPLPILQKSVRVQGIYVGSRDMFNDMNAFLANTKLKPVIDSVFPFEDTQAAYRHLKSGKHFGKIVIRLNS